MRMKMRMMRRMTTPSTSTKPQKSRTWATLNLSMCADKSRRRKKEEKKKNQVSPVTCDLSLAPTSSVKDPHPANYPTIHSRLVLHRPKNIDIFQNEKNHPIVPKNQINISDTLFYQRSPVHREAGFPGVDNNVATYEALQDTVFILLLPR